MDARDRKVELMQLSYVVINMPQKSIYMIYRKNVSSIKKCERACFTFLYIYFLSDFRVLFLMCLMVLSVKSIYIGKIDLFRPGASFGGLSLVSEHILRRSASVKANVHLQLAVLNREAFRRVCHKYLFLYIQKQIESRSKNRSRVVF